MKTALEQFIEQLEKPLEGKGKAAFKLVDKTTIAHLKLAKAFLQVEKEQIIDAYIHAQKEHIIAHDCYPPQFVVDKAANYYNETFKNDVTMF